MKNLFLAVLAALVTSISAAQNNETFIDVQGAAAYTKEVDRYQLEITISPNAYYSYDGAKPTTKEMKEGFFEHMKENGFEEGRFKLVKTVEYYRENYNQDGMVYSFDTGSKDEFAKLMGIKSLNGVNITNKAVTYKPLADRESVIAAALEEARKNAAIVAEALGKKLGGIIAVFDHYVPSFSNSGSYYQEMNESIYYVKVRFAFEL